MGNTSAKPDEKHSQEEHRQRAQQEQSISTKQRTREVNVARREQRGPSIYTKLGERLASRVTAIDFTVDGLVFCIPRELWRLILGSIPFLHLIRVGSVSWLFLELVCESVTTFDNTEGKHLTDAMASQLVSLKHLRLAYHYDRHVLKDHPHVIFLHLANFDHYKRYGPDLIVLTDVGIKHLTSLTSLYLGWNWTITDAGIKGLTNLTELDLRGNRRITGAALENLVKLKSLLLDSNPLITGEDVSKLTNLTRLDLKKVNITCENVEALPYLTSLWLSSERVFFADEVSRLTNLTDLSLSGQRGKLGDSCVSDVGLRGLTKLTSLNLADNCVNTDEGVSGLTNLKTLEVGGPKERPQITDNCLKRLTNLTNLDLSSNRTITGIGVMGLTNLTTLSLRNCETVGNDVLVRLTNLKTLDLSCVRYNNSVITDAGISGLTGLTSLNLSNNVPHVSDVALRRLTNLTRLSIASNRWISNDGIKDLVYLTFLDINKLISVEGISRLTNLTHLCITSGAIKDMTFVSGLRKLDTVFY